MRDPFIIESKRWRLKIVVYDDYCRLFYGNLEWELPRQLSDIWRDLLFAMPRGEAEDVYEKMERLTNRTLRRVNRPSLSWPTLEPPIFATRNYEWVSGASPVTDRGSNVHYLTAEEYETMRQAGELERNTMYLVLN